MALPSARRSQSARFCKGLYHGSNLRSSTAPTTASTILMVVQSCSASWWKKQDGCGDISQRTAQRNSRPHAPGMAIKRHPHDGRREPQWGELGANCESSSEKRVKINETKPKLTSEAAGGAGQLIHAVIVCSLPLYPQDQSPVFVSVFMLVQKFYILYANCS